ncbi:hypothetical protein DMB65_02470 [Flavobacterium cheongpyeongense]|jgi:hypothetical protein|uniref:Uncharacterized protein n=1 Tax=Flavobacterium cheongpyeongense TaxID=2212651 RepID=A0A2V4BWN5_9FLAO|nr:hypothetical protein [Flavobacterium cheongpyeongense]PXY42120.1 hypothetical protein DMB65_02470 [Flavobacterium cheongpyeongense]
MQNSTYLNSEEIQLLEDFNSKNKILSVFYYYWINTSNPDKHYRFIDVIELVFDDSSSVFFKINDDDSGIAITTEFEFEKYKTNLQTEFLQQIRLQKVEATVLDVWKTALISPFKKIEVVSEGSRYLSTAFLIAFENINIEFLFHPVEGLLVTEYE